MVVNVSTNLGRDLKAILVTAFFILCLLCSADCVLLNGLSFPVRTLKSLIT